LSCYVIGREIWTIGLTDKQHLDELELQLFINIGDGLVIRLDDMLEYEIEELLVFFLF
jgi:hypothetical protein